MSHVRDHFPATFSVCSLHPTVCMHDKLVLLNGKHQQTIWENTELQKASKKLQKEVDMCGVCQLCMLGNPCGQASIPCKTPEQVQPPCAA